MRNWNQYLELWQQKRNEQQISNDVQADWTEMHSLLDKHMPLNIPGSSGPNTGGQVAKQLSNLAKFKLFYVVSGLIVAGVGTYFAIRHSAVTKTNKPVKTEIRKDSLATNNILSTDSLSAANSNVNAGNAASHKITSSAATAPVNAPGKNDVNTGLTTIGNKTTGTIDAAKSADNKTLKNEHESVAHINAGKSTIKNSAAKSGSHNYNRALSSSNSLANQSGLNNTGQLRSNNRLGNNNDRNIADLHHPTNLRRSLQTGNSYPNPGEHVSSQIGADGYRDNNTLLLDPPPAPLAFTWDDIVAGKKSYPGSVVKYVPVRLLNNKPKAAKTRKNLTSLKSSNTGKSTAGSKSAIGSDLDWGILAGVNSSGSFTPKAQNHNVYGSLSPDITLGLFANYNITDDWAIGLQGRFFTPHTISGTYNYTHQLKADTAQVAQLLTITDSRKVYTVDVPLHLIYKATPAISLKAGALLSFPVKQINGANSFTISGPLRDSAVYYNSVTNSINATRFEKKIRVGASLGVGFTYKSLWLDATFNFQKQKLNSDVGSYTSNTNNLQLTIGITFNKSKK
jgi:hypothetical protein